MRRLLFLVNYKPEHVDEIIWFFWFRRRNYNKFIIFNSLAFHCARPFSNNAEAQERRNWQREKESRRKLWQRDRVQAGTAYIDERTTYYAHKCNNKSIWIIAFRSSLLLSFLSFVVCRVSDAGRWSWDERILRWAKHVIKRKLDVTNSHKSSGAKCTHTARRQQRTTTKVAADKIKRTINNINNKY